MGAADGPGGLVMGITFLYVPYVDDQATGVQRFASEMVRALRRVGLDAELVVGERHGAPPWLDGVPHRVALGRWASRVPRPVSALARAAWLQAVFPFVAGRGATLISLAHELAPFPAVRQVAVVHDLTDYKAYAERGGLGTRVRNLLWHLGLKRSAAVVAISEATRRDLVDVLGVNGATVVYEGVDRSRFSPAAGESSEATVAAADRPFLLYVGTLDPHKNVPFLMGVYQALIERGHVVDLVLAGRHRPEQVQPLTAELSGAARAGVRWAGFVDDAQLARLLATCAAFVFPSRNEGFGLAAAEAMACGAPVVSSDAGSLAEVVGAGGLLLSPDDGPGWVAALDRILTDPAHRDDLAARALARAEAFSWDRAAEAYRALIHPPGLR